MPSDFSPLEGSKKVRFDMTINLGHIMTFLGFMAAGFGIWSDSNSRLVILEEGKKTQAAIDHAQDVSARQVQYQLNRMDDKLDRILERRQ